MVSPEILRRYELFAGLTPPELNAIAMLTEHVTYEPGEIVFEADRPAEHLYLLLEGCAELDYVAVDEINPELRTELFVSEMDPGDVFGISALVEPFVYLGKVHTRGRSHVLRIEAPGLRALCERDPRVAATLMSRIARAALTRLHDTRVLLAAERA